MCRVHQMSVLPNGLRCLTSPMLHTRSVCIAVFIGAGSRYEDEDQAGLSHMIEHLCFKGTERYATSREISEAIEGVGGVLNGATDKELTIYWCKVARPHFALALDLMTDMLRHSRFDADDLEKERCIIIEEISESMDSPQHRAHMLIDEVVWPGNALGRDIAGSKESVGGLGRDVLLDYLARQYVPNNVVVSVAGDIGHDEVVSGLGAVLGDWKVGRPGRHQPATDSQRGPRVRVERRDSEQAHLCLAVHGLSVLHPDRFNLDLLNVVLGEGMSSRLFLEIRERQGLAYDVCSFVDHFQDAGAVTIYAGVSPGRVDVAVEGILHELGRLKEGIPGPELSKAKEFAKGRLLLRMEDTRNVAGWVGGQELLTGRVYSADEVVSIIDAITPEDLERVARELFVTDKLNLAVVGPVDGEERLQHLLKL